MIFCFHFVLPLEVKRTLASVNFVVCSFRIHSLKQVFKCRDPKLYYYAKALFTKNKHIINSLFGA